MQQDSRSRDSHRKNWRERLGVDLSRRTPDSGDGREPLDSLKEHGNISPLPVAPKPGTEEILKPAPMAPRLYPKPGTTARPMAFSAPAAKPSPSAPPPAAALPSFSDRLKSAPRPATPAPALRPSAHARPTTPLPSSSVAPKGYGPSPSFTPPEKIGTTPSRTVSRPQGPPSSSSVLPPFSDSGHQDLHGGSRLPQAPARPLPHSRYVPPAPSSFSGQETGREPPPLGRDLFYPSEYGEEEEEDKRSLLGISALAFAGALVLFSVLGYFLYPKISARFVSQNQAPPPLVERPELPLKAKPQVTGTVPSNDGHLARKQIYDRILGDNEPERSAVVPTIEEPVPPHLSQGEGYLGLPTDVPTSSTRPPQLQEPVPPPPDVIQPDG